MLEVAGTPAALHFGPEDPMIVVRDVFRLKFGKAREAVALWQEGQQFVRQSSTVRGARVLTDLVGEYYTLVLETSFDGLADFDRSLREETGNAEWRAWYQRFVPLAESGYREILTVVGSDVTPLGGDEAGAETRNRR
jgi:hypothetical protein